MKTRSNADDRTKTPPFVLLRAVGDRVHLVLHVWLISTRMRTHALASAFSMHHPQLPSARERRPIHSAVNGIDLRGSLRPGGREGE